MVYAIGAQGTDAVKIGFTDGDPTTRLAALQTGCPLPLELLAAWDGDREAEESIHAILTRLGARMHGEWFHLPHEPVRSTDGWHAARFGMAFYNLAIEKAGGMGAIFTRLRTMLGGS